VNGVMGGLLALFPRSNITSYRWLIFLGQHSSGPACTFHHLSARPGGPSEPEDDISHIRNIAGTAGGGLGVSMACWRVSAAARSVLIFCRCCSAASPSAVQYWSSRGTTVSPTCHHRLQLRPGSTGVDPICRRIRDLRGRSTRRRPPICRTRRSCSLELCRLDPQQVLSRQAQLDAGQSNSAIPSVLHRGQPTPTNRFLNHYPTFRADRTCPLWSA